MTLARCGIILVSLGAVACAGPVQPDARPVQGSVVLSRTGQAAGSQIVGTFRSIVDSLALSVTAGGTTQSIGHKFAAGETSFRMPIILPPGVAALRADILSNNGKTRLFSGSSSATIDHDGFSINVPLSPTTPVLTLFPDTVKLDVIKSTSQQGRFRYGSVTVRNSGRDSLAWSVQQIAQSPAGACAPECPTATPASGKLPANGEVVVDFSMLTDPKVFPRPGSVTFQFMSTEGTINLVWRYP